MTDVEMRDLCQKACDCLNAAFAADPNAMQALVANHIPCNQALADHPTVVVDEVPVLERGGYSVGLVGVLVGVFHSMGFPCTVASGWSDETDDRGRHKMTGFAVVDFTGITYGDPEQAKDA